MKVLSETKARALKGYLDGEPPKEVAARIN